MNKELLEDRWVEIKENIRERFSSLTDEDLKQINGHYDQLVLRLQQRYGLSREEAEAELRKWMPERFSKPIGSEKYANIPVEKAYQVKEEEGSSLAKWLVLLGFPLMFLLGFFVNKAYLTEEQKTMRPSATERVITTPQTTTPMRGTEVNTTGREAQITTPSTVMTPREQQAATSTNEVNITQSTNDQLLSQNIMDSLKSNRDFADIDNINITATKGVVTVNGTVSSATQHEAIIKFIQNFQGVTQVNDRIEIR